MHLHGCRAVEHVPKHVPVMLVGISIMFFLVGLVVFFVDFVKWNLLDRV